MLMSVKDYHSKYRGVEDTSLDKITKRGMECYAAVRRINIKTTRQLQSKLVEEGVSLGMCISLKLYYIGAPSLREQILCMCGFCLNTKQLYNAVKKASPAAGDSISDFLCRDFKCGKGANGYCPLECVTGSCEQRCKPCTVTTVEEGPDYPLDFLTYYQFERKKIPYVSKKGEAKESKRVVRVDYTQELDQILNLLSYVASPYLYHRYLVANENHTWPKILATASPQSSTWIIAKTLHAHQNTSLNHGCQHRSEKCVHLSFY